MPIQYNAKEGWVLKDTTPEELDSLITIGKMMVVQGIGGAYTNERYKQWLINADKGVFFNT